MRNGPGRLPTNIRIRSIPSVIRYENEVPGHHAQIDWQFLDFSDPDGRKVRRFQYTAIDDATRIRAPQVYDKHNRSTRSTSSTT